MATSSRLIFLFILCLLSATIAESQTLCEQSSSILNTLNEKHVRPRNINVELAVDATHEFFSSLDPYALYFTTEDLKADSVAVSVEMLQGKGPCNWMRHATSLYKKKLTRVSKIISSCLSKPLEFTGENFITIGLLQHGNFCKNDVELAAKWKHWLSYEILAAIYDTASTRNAVMNPKTLLSYEPAVRKEVEDKELKKIEEILNNSTEIENEVRELFLKSLTKIFDPHSDFFSNSEMKNFEEHISTTESSFGFDIKENNAMEFYVFRITPGSPAWNSNEIHVGDILLEIKGNNGNFKSMSDFDNPVSIIKEWKKEEIEVKIKRADGRIVSVKLIKEKIESAENRVQGFVLNGTKKIGYVALPSFYKEWDSDNKNNGGCADDLAKEIIKLKKEGISGLILDLRFNGGGSVQEAIEIAGIFIDFGPVAIVKLENQLITMKDTNKGSVYDGPLMIMVNGASASASEFVAAALQDYNRALIVGTSTYGKGTGQRIFSSDSLKQEFLKITDMKLYRITGKSNQRRGVTPDVIIPDLTEEFMMKEKSAKHVIFEDSVTKKVYYTASQKPDLSKIKLASNNRILQNSQFKIQDSLKHFYRQPLKLNIDDFIEREGQSEHFANAINNSNATSKFKATHNQFDQSLLNIDTYRKTLSDELLEKINKSVFIEEAYLIMSDYINQIKK